MLQGNNILKFYTNKNLRYWDISDNNSIVVYLKTGLITPFILLTTDERTSCVVGVYDANTDIQVDTDYSVTVSDNEDKKQLRYEGSLISSMDDGCYYYKLTYTQSGETPIEYYSDVFKWVEDTDSNRSDLGLLKLVITSSNLTLNNKYVLDLTNFEFNFFLYVENPNININSSDDGGEKPKGNIPLFNTRTLGDEYEIIGGEGLHEFISTIRTLSVNGNISYIWNGIEKEAFEVVFDQGDKIGKNTYSSKSELKHSFISSRNAV